MQQILQNLALIHLIDFCKGHNIDCSDTRIYKYPRKYIYALLPNKGYRAIVTLSFHKSQRPAYFIHKNN